MMEKAAAVGLVIDGTEVPRIAKENWMPSPTDSYGQFLGGGYAKTHPCYYRGMQLGEGLNEVLDDSVRNKCRDDAAYRPQNQGFPVALIA